MNTTDELRGTLVMVHPKLFNDPAGKQGEIGMITHAELDKDDIYVSFSKGQQALYGTDALLVLKNHRDVFRDMMYNATKMNVFDFKDLFRLNLFQQSATAKDMRSAIELARGNEVIRKYSMGSLREQLGLAQDKSRDTEYAPAFEGGR